MKTDPRLITGNNLAAVWSQAYLHAQKGSPGSLTVSLDLTNSLEDQEDDHLKTLLDDHLRKNNTPTIDQTALTIVPYERWLRMEKPSVEELSKWYLKQLLPRLKARDRRNCYGTYFERLVGFTGVKNKGGQTQIETVNQLQYVVDEWEKGKARNRPARPRQSALQLACFDPAKDDTGSALRGFPCLQQISFTYDEAGTLEINAYYPTQYLLDRGYGNYLGLCQLGVVVAHQLEVQLTRLSCFIANPETGKAKPSNDLQQVITRLGTSL